MGPSGGAPPELITSSFSCRLDDDDDKAKGYCHVLIVTR